MHKLEYFQPLVQLHVYRQWTARSGKEIGSQNFYSLSHPANPVLELLVGGVNPEGEFERLLSLLLAYLPQLATELVILVIPGSEHGVAVTHHL